MTGLVIQSVDHIAKQDQEDGWLVFANHVGNKIMEVPNGLHLRYVIAVVDGNEDYYDETDVREDPNDRGYNSCEEKMTEHTMQWKKWK